MNETTTAIATELGEWADDLAWQEILLRTTTVHDYHRLTALYESDQRRLVAVDRWVQRLNRLTYGTEVADILRELHITGEPENSDRCPLARWGATGPLDNVSNLVITVDNHHIEVWTAADATRRRACEDEELYTFDTVAAAQLRPLATWDPPAAAQAFIGAFDDAEEDFAEFAEAGWEIVHEVDYDDDDYLTYWRHTSEVAPPVSA